MKNVKFLLAGLLAFVGAASLAQDFSDPRYAPWGDTPEARKDNLFASNFLKEAITNRDYNGATGYFWTLVRNCPEASEATFIRGASAYSNKVAMAKTLDEKKLLLDTLMMVYDLRVQYFPESKNYGKAYVLDRKAREYMTYNPSDRDGIRRYFREAVDAGLESGYDKLPELTVIYFSNLCEDYKNDSVYPDEVMAEYERLTPVFAGDDPVVAESKKQFDNAFGVSGAASCENLETLFRARIEADPGNLDLLEQAVVLMSRAGCDSDFFLSISEKYYEARPISQTAMMLAQGFQEKGYFDKATRYLREALASETDPAEQELLYVRISMVELAAHRIAAAAEAARQAKALNPENGFAYFILGQCYAASAANCPGLAGQAAYWAAYDAMSQAASLLEGDSSYQQSAQASMASYRKGFPTTEECFFNELKEGDRYTVNCGAATGVVTTVRPR